MRVSSMPSKGPENLITLPFQNSDKAISFPGWTNSVKIGSKPEGFIILVTKYVQSV